jgi:hypothetical protein
MGIISRLVQGLKTKGAEIKSAVIQSKIESYIDSFPAEAATNSLHAAGLKTALTTKAVAEAVLGVIKQNKKLVAIIATQVYEYVNSPEYTKLKQEFCETMREIDIAPSRAKFIFDFGVWKDGIMQDIKPHLAPKEEK